MDADLEDNRRGVLSAAQHARLSSQSRGASWWDRHVRAASSGHNLAALVTKAPDGLAADLTDRRVVCVEGTIGLEPMPAFGPAMQSWLVRLDDGSTLGLAPGVLLPPGRQRLYHLPRSRWVIHGEPRPEQWQDYRALVLQAQRLGLAEVDSLHAGKLPPGQATLLRSRTRVWWIPALLWAPWLIAAGGLAAFVTWETLVFTVLLCLVGSWAARRLVQVHRDIGRGAVTFVDGPVHIEVELGRNRPRHTLIVDGIRFRMPASELMPVALREGFPCRLYYAPTSGLFVAIEPLV